MTRSKIYNNPTRQCEKCNVEITTKYWAKNLKCKSHLKNDPHQTINPFECIKLSEKCNIKVGPVGWDAYLKMERHLLNEPYRCTKL